MSSQSPRWLTQLERRIGWLEIPHISILLLTLQGLGFVFVMMDPLWVSRLALIPEAVRAGQVWRLVTFLALPVSLQPLWMLMALWFLYFILETLESAWGAFRTTFYVLISIVITIAYAMTFDYPVTQISHFQSTLFLAVAALFPEQELRIFFFIPAKMKWLAWLSMAFLLLELWQGSWLDRFFLLAIYSNFAVFFGPAAVSEVKLAWRRYDYRRKMRR